MSNLNEEEKKAIEYFKALNKLTFEPYLSILLKLLDKQQKEIGQFYKEINLNTEIHKRDVKIKELTEVIQCLHETDKEFISKDKIREKIKELSKTQAYKVGLEEYTIKILQELLEE